MSIKDLPLATRPRERLAHYGKEALSAIELLAIILGSGTKNRSVLQLASDLLSHFGSVKALSEASLEELKEVRGIGNAKALQLLAAFALHWRLEEEKPQPLLDQPEKIYALIRPDLSHQKTEMLMVVMRDVRCCLIHREILSKGTLTELLLHPREVFHAAIRHRAHSIAIAHNHPSGDPTPSLKDIEMTQILAETGKMIGIRLFDHIIVGRNSFVSLRERGVKF
jgi:DNA repair protein RadC